MLRILGSARRLCDGWTRRDLLAWRPESLRFAGCAFAAPARSRNSPPTGRRRWLRPGQGVHPALPLRGAQPAGNLRPEARRSVRRARRLQAVRDLGAGPTHLRAPAAHGPPDAPDCPGALDVAPVQHPLGSLHPDRRSQDGHPDGAEPPRWPALAIRRLRNRLVAGAGERSCRAPGASQPGSALEVQQPIGALPTWRPLRRLSGQRV